MPGLIVAMFSLFSLAIVLGVIAYLLLKIQPCRAVL